MKPDLRPDLLSLALGGLAIGIAEFVPMGVLTQTTEPICRICLDGRCPARPSGRAFQLQ
jgi:hypothetical protein